MFDGLLRYTANDSAKYENWVISAVYWHQEIFFNISTLHNHFHWHSISITEKDKRSSETNHIMSGSASQRDCMLRETVNFHHIRNRRIIKRNNINRNNCVRFSKLT